ncbi:basic proline-rich protein-like [Strigops habroptila]|uniref:basic proline-rich protein-like n=1 Tax=Strigops habroptila TaxID=2489341 RepID=UPI0011CF864E|nr:basic proline-rich protein-like [Strigops habroptila]
MGPQHERTWGSCRRAAELLHVLRGEGASSGSDASLVLPMRQLEFPEPARHPQGKPGSERPPKNSCPGHREKGNLLQDEVPGQSLWNLLAPAEVTLEQRQEGSGSSAGKGCGSCAAASLSQRGLPVPPGAGGAGPEGTGRIFGGTASAARPPVEEPLRAPVPVGLCPAAPAPPRKLPGAPRGAAAPSVSRQSSGGAGTAATGPRPRGDLAEAPVPWHLRGPIAANTGTRPASSSCCTAGVGGWERLPQRRRGRPGAALALGGGSAPGGARPALLHLPGVQSGERLQRPPLPSRRSVGTRVGLSPLLIVRANENECAEPPAPCSPVPARRRRLRLPAPGEGKPPPPAPGPLPPGAPAFLQRRIPAAACPGPGSRDRGNPPSSARPAAVTKAPPGRVGARCGPGPGSRQRAPTVQGVGTAVPRAHGSPRRGAAWSPPKGSSPAAGRPGDPPACSPPVVRVAHLPQGSTAPRGGRAESRVGRGPGCPHPPRRPPPPRLAPRQVCANPPAPPLTGSRAREAPPP